MNLLATAALLLIGLSQVLLAYQALVPSPQEIQFLAVQEFCKQKARGAADGLL